MKWIRKVRAYLQGIYEHLCCVEEKLTKHTDPALAAAYRAGWDLSDRYIGRPHA